MNSYSNIIVIPVSSIFILFLGAAIVKEPRTGAALALLPLLLWVVLCQPKMILYLLLLLLPFQSVPALNQNIAGITGAKPVNIIAVAALVVLFMFEGSILRFRDALEKKALFVIAVYFLFFTVSFFRSLDNLSLFHQLLPGQFQASAIAYTLSFYIKPALYLVAPLMIIKMFYRKEDVEKIIAILLISLFILSCCVIVIGIANFSEITLLGRSAVRELYGTYLGMHYNSIGTIYIVMTPILVAKALEKRVLVFYNLLLAVTAMLILQSRTTLLTFILTGSMLLFVSKKKKYIIVTCAITILIIIFWLPLGIIRGLTSGLEQGSFDGMLSGRVSHLWIPLLCEWVSDPIKFLIGKGQYSLLTSPLWSDGYLVQALQAHNAFLNYFFNNGILLFVCLVFFVTSFTISAWKMCRKINTIVYWSLFFSIIGYLVGCLTERYIYPHQDNMLLLPVIAVMLNLARLDFYADNQ